MIKHYQKVTWLLQSFEKEKKDVLLKLDQLQMILNDYPCKEKLRSKKHLRDIERIIKFLKGKYFLHIKLDEGVIFPFLEKHVPRLEPVLRLLRDERNKFKGSLETFEELYKRFIATKGEDDYNKIMSKLKEKGTYLTCLARNHIQMEDENVYKVIKTELHGEEKNKLMNQLQECC